MEANELRIGNYVLDSENKICTIGNGMAFFNIEKINPIPITEELLKKFGFKWYNPGYYAIKTLDCKRISPQQLYRDEWHCQLFLKYDNGYHNKGTISIIKYIHQLQNLYFALTGKELIKKE